MYRVLGADQKEYGPISADQVRAWILERRLTAGTLVQMDGSVGWKPLSTFPEFSIPLASVGAASPYNAPTIHSGSQNPMAIAGLVCGVLGVICCWCAPLFAVLAIVFSIIALSQIKNNPLQGGKPLAIAGLVLGGFSVVMFVIGILIGAFGRLIDKLR